MFKNCILIAIACFTITSQANPTPNVFSGTWNGKGTYVLNGEISQCSEFQLVFSSTADTFTFVRGHRVCDHHSEKFYKVDMTYRDGKLFFYGTEVGSYDGNTLQASYRAPDGNTYRNWRMFMRREGSNLMYEESRIMDGEADPLISFAGMLVLEQN